MSNPLAVQVDGVRWVPFAVSFKTQEGTFSFHLYAVDRTHAIDRLEELKATAQLDQEVIEILPGAERRKKG
jgi:hypothetical protein